MKLNAKSQLGLNVTGKMVSAIMKRQYESQSYKEANENNQAVARKWFTEIFYKEISNVISRDEFKRVVERDGGAVGRIGEMKTENYLIAQTAIELAKRIKIDEDKFDMKFLSKVKDQKITFLLGQDNFIRYVKRENLIFAIKVTSVEVENAGQHISYISFMIDTETGEVNYANKSDAPLSDPEFKFFVQLLVFTELSRLEIKILNPKEKFGTRKTGKYINESNQKVTIVDSVWNKMVVRATGFGVSGHWRWQVKGVGRSEMEYIFIEEFRKKGYIRMPKKEEATIN